MAELLEEKVHAEHHELPTPNNNEGGEDSPMKISYGKSMMWYFLLSDAFTFSAFLISYGAIRLSSDWWPDPNHVFNGMPFMHNADVPLGFVSIMTFILILSSVFVVRAVQEGHRMNKKGVLVWMGLGILGGIAFLGCQAWEWSHLIHDGMSPFINIYYAGENGETLKWNVEADGMPAKTLGPPLFGALFFGITGFHGFHVFTGVVLNIIGFVQTATGVYHRRGHYEMIEKLGLYWHFVDLVWVFVFLAFYLL